MEKKGKGKLQHQRSTPKKNAKASTKKDAVLATPPNNSQSAPISTELIKMSVDNMTSRDFQLDTHAHIDVTSQVLKDHICIRTFQLAIDMNKHLFRGKTVLEIGCGTGILSLFVAKAGAARVFAVDPSRVVDYTRKIVAANNFAHVIEVIQGRIEDISLPVDQVDVIICDWMGYSLLYQSTCDAVIYARDKWLRRDPSAVIFPDVAKLYIAGFVDPERKNEKIEWWKDVHNFNMKALRDFALSEPSFYAMHSAQIITEDFNVKTINLYTATRFDLGFQMIYNLRVQRSGLMDGIVTYFTVRFSKSHVPFTFSTSPWSPHTHWMQAVFFFDQAVAVHGGEIVCGGFKMMPADRKNPNLNNIEVSLEMCSNEPVQLQVDMHWHMKPHAASMAASVADPLASPQPQKNATAKATSEEPAVSSSPCLAAILKKQETSKNSSVAEKVRKKDKKC